MWERIAKNKEVPPALNVIVYGPGLTSLPSEFGPLPQPSEIVTYQQADLDSDGAIKATVNTFRVQVHNPVLLEHIPFRRPCVLVCVLSWLHTEEWPDVLKDLSECMPTDAKLLLTTSDYQELGKSQRFSMLSDKLDFCHQYLRTVALKLAASLAYSIEEDAKLDWLAIVSRVLNVPGLGSEALSEQLYGSSIIVLGSDSKEKILAVNPSFELENAWDDRWTPPAVVPSRSEELSSQPIKSLPEELAETLASFNAREAPSLPVDLSRSRSVIAQGDDKKVISEFFSTIAQKSS